MTDPTRSTRPEPRRALGVAALAGLAAWALWNIDALAPLLFPSRLLTTFAHEAAHGTAAAVTGGDFLRFEVASNGSGVALTTGGWRWFVLPAGYVGSALIAGGVLVAANRARRVDRVVAVLTVLVAVVAVWFGWRSPLTLVFGLAWAAALGLLARVALDRPTLTIGTLDLIGVLIGLSALSGLLTLVRSPDASAFGVPNDAAAFADHIGVGSTRMWALSWLLVAALVLFAAVTLAVGGRLPSPDQQP